MHAPGLEDRRYVELLSANRTRVGYQFRAVCRDCGNGTHVVIGQWHDDERLALADCRAHEQSTK